MKRLAERDPVPAWILNAEVAHANWTISELRQTIYSTSDTLSIELIDPAQMKIEH